MARQKPFKIAMSSTCSSSDIPFVSNHIPLPPRVFAPDRLGTDQPASSLGPVTVANLTSVATTPRADGAQVTAVVGPVQVSTPQVSIPRTLPGAQLPRTGVDYGPVLLLALVLVLLGLVLVRLAVPRATSSARSVSCL